MVLNETIVGEVCHICAESSQGPRYNPAQTDEERRAYENLILLCQAHHSVVDDDTVAYTVARLKTMKDEHEANTVEMSSADADRAADRYFEGGMLSVNQSGGLAAQSIYAETINVLGDQAKDDLTRSKQIAAIEATWLILRELQREFSNIVTLEGLLTEEELADCFSQRSPWPPSYRWLKQEYISVTAVSLRVGRITKDLDQHRLYISMALWGKVYGIRAFYGRLGVPLPTSFEGDRYRNWRTDNGMDQILHSVLLKAEIAQIKQNSFHAIHRPVSYLDAHFLALAGLQRPS